MLVVNEFLDIFLEDLSRVPSPQAVDFCIELELSTKSISNAPVLYGINIIEGSRGVVARFFR